jgi:hypothetical protein
MSVSRYDIDGIKRKVRKLKQTERAIRFGSAEAPALVWDDFFGKRYTYETLAAMTREDYRNAVDEYFAFVYFAYYQENGIAHAGTYDPSLLAKLGLPPGAGGADVKKRFRALAKERHPDAGGDACAFIELMEIYKLFIIQ